MKLLYSGAILPSVTYAFSIWADHFRVNRGLARSLNSVQRPVLVAITGAYRTAPSNVLQVHTGLRPLDQEVRIRSELFARQKALATQQPYRAFADIDNDAIGEWQNRWDTVHVGRITYDLIPSVRWRLARP